LRHSGCAACAVRSIWWCARAADFTTASAENRQCGRVLSSAPAMRATSSAVVLLAGTTCGGM
jgi:hypothetical protein